MRSARQQKAIVDAARRLVEEKGGSFTTEADRGSGDRAPNFYRYFAGKDQLFLAVFEDLIGESAVLLEQQASDIDDPAARLRFYVTWMLRAVGPARRGRSAQFVTSEHWRLHQMFPDDVARVTQPITDLFERSSGPRPSRAGSTAPTRRGERVVHDAAGDVGVPPLRLRHV